MTIITKPFSDKKDKLVVPLVDNEHLAPPTAPDDVEGQTHPRIIIFPARAHRVSTATTLCVFVTALIVVSIGIIGGKILYDEYLSVSRHSKYEGWANIPMDESSENYADAKFEGWANIPMKDVENFDDDAESRNINEEASDIDDYFQESFEIDDERKYEKIDVPDFRDGRSGRFIHDFNTNITGIIDITGHRCFVMPLNRDNVLPPKSLFDLIHKMWDGYYKVDTDVVRKSMKVVLPPIKDTKNIGNYIANECDGLPIYKLEKYVGGVVKRSADLHSEAKFAQFAGKGVTEFDIMNLEEVLSYEKQLNSH